MERAIAFNAADAPTVEFTLPNLVCDDEECAIAVKDILARQPGAKDVLVDVDAKKATVAIEGEKFDSELALAVLTDKGFNLELVTAAAFNPTGAPTVEFTVPDMMCEEGCAAAVKEILSEQPGAKDVRVDFEAKLATVAIEMDKFDSKLAIAELVDKGFANSQLKTNENQTPPVPSKSDPSATGANLNSSVKNQKENKEAPMPGAIN